MNEKPATDRLLRLAPLVLRWGVASILILNGVSLVGPMADNELGRSVRADGDGVAISANWDNLLGAAQIGVGGLLLAGLVTRLTSLGVLAAVGYCVFDGVNSAGSETVGAAAQLYETSGEALLLLAAACASLMVSGPGCLGLDGRLARRGKTPAVASA